MKSETLNVNKILSNKILSVADIEELKLWRKSRDFELMANSYQQTRIWLDRLILTLGKRTEELEKSKCENNSLKKIAELAISALRNQELITATVQKQNADFKDLNNLIYKENDRLLHQFQLLEAVQYLTKDDRGEE